MELREALEILNKNYTSTWEGAMGVVTTPVNLTDEVYAAWKVVREHLKEERKKDPKPVYPMTPFREACLKAPLEVFKELGFGKFQVDRWKEGSGSPHRIMQEMIIEKLKEKGY